MPDLKEVFEMVKQHTEPDLDSWQEQERRMRRSTRIKKAGVFALLAALIVAVTVFAVNTLDDGDGGTEPPFADPADPVELPTTGFVWVDINTGERTGTGVLPASSSIDVSPDGTRIVYVDISGGSEVVHVANADGSNARAFDSTEGAQAPRWSSDGTLIVYQNKPLPGFKIGNLFVLNTATGTATQITDLEQVSSGLWWMAPTFSPDGRSVLFTMPSTNGSRTRWDLWSAPVTGGEPELVTENAIAGDYSPDGKSIVYTEQLEVDGEPQTGALYVARLPGDARVVVEGSVGFARWSPDGTMLVYDTDDGLSVLDVETGESRLLLEGIGDFADWVDDDTVIIEIDE